MLVRERLVCVEGIASLRMMSVRCGLGAGTRRTGLSIDDHAATQHIVHDQRRQAQQRRRREAARIRYAASGPDHFTICFRQAIDELRLGIHRRMLASIVLCECQCVAETKIPGQIDYFHV